MESKINNNLKKLNTLNHERIFWLRISGFVALSCFLVVFNWNTLVSNGVIWIVGSFGLLITIIWWYWTMSIIRKLIEFKTTETEIMNDLISDIKEIKQDVKKTFDQIT